MSFCALIVVCASFVIWPVGSEPGWGMGTEPRGNA
jgi:hypothetical protein